MPHWETEGRIAEKSDGGVYLGDTEIKTTDIPHKRIELPLPWNPKANCTVSYYVAKYPEGDYAIHYHVNNGRQDGYGGANVTFLLEDGSYEVVQGPFYGGWEDCLTDHLPEPVDVRRIRIGYSKGLFCEIDTIFVEPYTVGDWLPRLKAIAKEYEHKGPFKARVEGRTWAQVFSWEQIQEM